MRHRHSGFKGVAREMSTILWTYGTFCLLPIASDPTRVGLSCLFLRAKYRVENKPVASSPAERRCVRHCIATRMLSSSRETVPALHSSLTRSTDMDIPVCSNITYGLQQLIITN